MRRMISTLGRHPVTVVLLSALIVGLGSFAALSATTPASPETEPAPTGQVPPVPRDGSDPAARAIAKQAAAEAGQGVRAGSVRLAVPASGATAGFALWSWVTDEGRPSHMIVDPDGTPVVWSGCSTEPVRYIDRCAGWATPTGILVLAGRASDTVVGVEVAGERLARQPAVLGDGGWMWVGRDFPPDTPADQVPDRVIAKEAGGQSHTIPVAP